MNSLKWRSMNPIPLKYVGRGRAREKTHQRKKKMVEKKEHGRNTNKNRDLLDLSICGTGGDAQNRIGWVLRRRLLHWISVSNIATTVCRTCWVGAQDTFLRIQPPLLMKASNFIHDFALETHLPGQILPTKWGITHLTIRPPKLLSCGLRMYSSKARLSS